MTGGRSPKRKGNSLEYEARDFLREFDPNACRVVGSGAFGHVIGMDALRGDVRARLTNRDWVVECKRSKNGHLRLYKWLEKDGADALCLRSDHKEALWVVPQSKLRELIRAIMQAEGR